MIHFETQSWTGHTEWYGEWYHVRHDSRWSLNLECVVDLQKLTMIETSVDCGATWNMKMKRQVARNVVGHDHW